MPTPPLIKIGIVEMPAKEKILLYGDSDLGKTYNYLKIAEWHQRRGSKAKFYGICTPGNEWTKFWTPGGEFAHLTNVQFFPVTDIQDYFDAFDKHIKRQAKTEDWLALDVIGDAWNASMEEYAEREWGTDLGSKWATEGGKYPIGGADWPWGSINARHKALIQNRMLRFPGHLMCMAWDKKLSTKEGEEKDQQALELFSLVGYKNVGQKDDYRRFDTVLHLSLNGEGKRVVRTVRDRGGRKRLGNVVQMGKSQAFHGVPVGDFFTQYLVGVAGWKP